MTPTIGVGLVGSGVGEPTTPEDEGLFPEPAKRVSTIRSSRHLPCTYLALAATGLK